MSGVVADGAMTGKHVSYLPIIAMGSDRRQIVSELVVVSYPEENRAEQVLNTLQQLQKEYLVDLADACYVTKDQNGKLKLHQSVNLTAAGAATGAFWGMLFGLLFLSPLVGMVVGAGAGALSGKLRDYGIDDDFIRRLSAQLQPGTSALFVLVRKSQPDRVLPEISHFGGTVLHTSLSTEQEAKLRAALGEAQEQAPAQA
jgi:uncharacterized membrane protein